MILNNKTNNENNNTDDNNNIEFISNTLLTAGTTEHLVITLDFVGCISEVRLYAKKRSSDELVDTKDFHLDIAEL